MNAPLPAAFLSAPSLRIRSATTISVVALALIATASLHAAPGSGGGQLLGVEIFPVTVKPTQAAEETRLPAETEDAPVEVRESDPPVKFAFFCFGPVFGNDSREIDPNYMPPPTAVDESAPAASRVVPVRYLRVPSIVPERTTWVGYDGSQISYRSRSDAHPRGAPTAEANLARVDSGGGRPPPFSLEHRANAPKEPSVAELIAENRKEMTRISWERTYRRFPELEREDSPEREAFESYILKKHADPRSSAAFDSPMWPEATAKEFMAERNWHQAEQASWDRVRAKVRIFNDPESVYTRRFMDFAASLREDVESAAVFSEPTWPEKALELHDQRFGPVPEQFR